MNGVCGNSCAPPNIIQTVESILVCSPASDPDHQQNIIDHNNKAASASNIGLIAGLGASLFCSIVNGDPSSIARAFTII